MSMWLDEILETIRRSRTRVSLLVLFHLLVIGVGVPSLIYGILYCADVLGFLLQTIVVLLLLLFMTFLRWF